MADSCPCDCPVASNGCNPITISNLSLYPATPIGRLEMQPLVIATFWNDGAGKCKSEIPLLLDGCSHIVLDYVLFHGVDSSLNGCNFLHPSIVWPVEQFKGLFFNHMGHFGCNPSQRNSHAVHLNSMLYSTTEASSQVFNLGEILIADYCRKCDINPNNVDPRVKMAICREVNQCEYIGEYFGSMRSHTWDEMIRIMMESKSISRFPADRLPGGVDVNHPCRVIFHIDVYICCKTLRGHKVRVSVPFYVDLSILGFYCTPSNCQTAADLLECLEEHEDDEPHSPHPNCPPLPTPQVPQPTAPPS